MDGGEMCMCILNVYILVKKKDEIKSKKSVYDDKFMHCYCRNSFRAIP